ncbi:Flp pilus assembly protein TadD [Phycicoccus badiiscoriae]|uniref:Flp pilus assembly protein TadD n=1 Tax=Pedococcus badiiscoriae TaxID=642776 RepID=A0A852WCG4_9MICO|nr:tetratricopeptide repeat protein [Pedococcus badiiscoriae]NYG06823.1 Flp pilus assembly protein TadD [Pedococcus badiiscoriae]
MTTNSTPFALRLEWARSRFDDGDFSAAVALLRELVEESESETSEHLHGTADLRLMLARAYFGSAQLGRAETLLRALAEESPDDGYVHLLLGRTLQRQRRYTDAQRHLALAEVLGDYERPAAYGGVSVATR